MPNMDSRSKPPPDPRLEQSSGEQKSQQGALLEPIGRLWDSFRRRSPSPSRKRDSSTPDQPAVASSSQAHNPIVPFGGHGSPSSSMSGGALFVLTSSNPPFPTPPSGAQGSSTISVSAPIVQISHSQASAEIVVQAAAPPQTKSVSRVWTKALKLAEKKLNTNNLPPLNLTNLTSRSAEENIESIIKALNTLQEDDRKKRWSYTWRGKEVLVVERLRKILKKVEKYTKVVDIAIQANPQKQSKALR
ncbi:hypothetical protein BGX38DRAFT_248194 [Terfezia claveryi]|nr:hypothetical protein BGX38DRAFT_248194 [Terfezia claveryi]